MKKNCAVSNSQLHYYCTLKYASNYLNGFKFFLNNDLPSCGVMSKRPTIILQFSTFGNHWVMRNSPGIPFGFTTDYAKQGAGNFELWFHHKISM